MKVATNQKIVMFSIAFFSIFNYLVILIALVSATDSFHLSESIALIFGIGMIISIVSSMIIIRHQLENNPPFQHTIIKLAVAHIPVITAFVISLFLFL